MPHRLAVTIFLLGVLGCGGAVETGAPDAVADDTGDPPDAAFACASATDCTDPLLPYCVEGACVACDVDAACSADAPVCDDTIHACGACAQADDCAAYPDQPVCGGDGACRGCALDDECASGACDFDTGACYAASEVVLVAPGGSTSSTCGGASAPCGSLAAAAPHVTADRPIVRMLPGTYGGQSLPAMAVPLVVHATGARIRVATLADTVGLFLAPGANLRMFDGRIEVAAVTGAAFRAVDVPAGATAILRRTDVDMTGSPATALESEGMLVADGVTIRATGAAVAASAGSFQLTHSRVTGGAGVFVRAPSFGIANNVFAYATGTAVVIDSPLGTPKQLAFNTFLANGALISAGPTELDVVRAVLPGLERFSATHNVFTNARSYTGPSGVVLVRPTPTVSLLDQPNLPPAADTNIYAPAAVDPEGKLTAASPAIDAVAVAEMPDDIDRDHRPAGAGYDLGADEYVP